MPPISRTSSRVQDAARRLARRTDDTAAPEAIDQQLDCPCGAMALLCTPKTEPETSVRFAEMGLSDTKAEILDDRLSIVSAR